MPQHFKPKPSICTLLSGLLLSLPFAQAEITSQTLSPITLDQTEITRPVLEKPEPLPDRSNQIGTFRREHYTLKTTYGKYARLNIEETPIALQGSGIRRFLYTVQNVSNEPIALTLHNPLTPEQAMKEVKDGRIFWALGPVVLLPGSIVIAGQILYFPIKTGMNGISSPSKYSRLCDTIFFSLLTEPILIPLAALTVAGGAIATVILLPISLVKTAINLAMAKRNDRLAKSQIKSSDFKQEQSTISIPAGQSVQFAILSQKHSEKEQFPLFTIVSSHDDSP